MNTTKKKSISTVLAILVIALVAPFVFMLSACGSKLNVREVSTQEELKLAIADEKVDEIKLTSNIDSDGNFEISRKVTIDLNGKTLKGNGANGVILAVADADVTITGNGTIIAKESSDRYAMVIWARYNSKVTIEDGIFTQEITGPDSQYDMIYITESAQLTIEGGKFDCHTPKWTLNIQDKDVATAKFIVKGGIFKGYNPAEAMTEPNSPVNFVAEGYESVLIKGTTDYKVVIA